MSSKRHRRRRECEGKVPHADVRQARRAAARRMAETHIPFEVYRCDFGGHYHVGRPRRLYVGSPTRG